MEFRVLGAVEVWAGSVRHDAGLPQQRAVLAALLVDAGRVVGTETLLDRVWGDNAPPTGRQSLHSHIARIRRMLRQVTPEGEEPVTLSYRSGGYLLDVAADQVDLHRFRRLRDRARGQDRTDDDRAELWRQAVGLWRGEPLTGLSGEWAARMRESWRRERLDAVVSWAQAELRVGNTGTVLGPLTDLSGEHPLAESLTAALMRALVAAGRSSDALDQYLRIRQRLADELGTDPGGELQELYRSILRGASGPTPAEDTTRPRPPRYPAPAQLPADVPGFAGRRDHLRHLDGLLGEEATPRAPAALIYGSAGVGKTALVLHWAHRTVDRFPDGQLYVNLRGFQDADSVMEPAEAIRGFLDALGASPDRIPTSFDAQVSLYRSMLAGKRILVVLDNASDTEQVRPLLPGAPGCLALITSRNQLTGLVAAHAARPVVLDLLTHDEARELLVQRIDDGRMTAEPDAAEHIITACARLPLALAIAAARAQQTRFPLTTLATQLTSADNRLDALDTGDFSTAIRTVFSWSYRALVPQAAELFRRLGLHPGPDITIAAAASLTGRPHTETRHLLADLVRTSLVTEYTPGRYVLHDLLRAYAVDLAHTHDTPDQRRAITARMIDHYLHTAYTADQLLRPVRTPIPLEICPPAPGTRPERLTDPEQATAWLTAELPVLLAVHSHADGAGFDTQLWKLAWSLQIFLYERHHWRDLTTVWQVGLGAATRLDHPVAQATAHRFIAGVDYALHRYAECRARLQSAIDLHVKAGDQIGQAYAHHNMGLLHEQQGEHTLAAASLKQALDLFRAAGSEHGQAVTLNAIGWLHALSGYHTEALAYCEQGLVLYRRLGDRHGQAVTLDSLGYVHSHLGDHALAMDFYQQALTLYRAERNPHGQVVVLMRLAEEHQNGGHLDAANECRRRALDILEDLGHPDADTVRATLDVRHTPGGRHS